MKQISPDDMYAQRKQLNKKNRTSRIGIELSSSILKHARLRPYTESVMKDLDFYLNLVNYFYFICKRTIIIK